jgi:hypothetical protein
MVGSAALPEGPEGKRARVRLTSGVIPEEES